MKKRLIIVGGLGSGEVAMSVFEDSNKLTDEWQIEGYLSDVNQPGEYLGAYKIIGTTDEVREFVDKGYYIHYTLHFHTHEKQERIKKFLDFNIPPEANATAIHPLAYVNPAAKLGFGVSVSPFAYISGRTEIGNYNHLYPHSVMSHESSIGDFCTLCVHSVIGARTVIGDGVHVGIQSSIREKLTVGKYAIIGMGANVVKDIDDYSIVVGNPARKIGENSNLKK